MSELLKEILATLKEANSNYKPSREYYLVVNSDIELKALLKAQLAKSKRRQLPVSEIKQGLKEISEGKVVPLNQLEERLDSPAREKIRNILLSYRANAEKIQKEWSATKEDERIIRFQKLEMNREKHIDQILALFDEIREQGLVELKARLYELEKKLDDREADLIEAKQEGRLEVVDWVVKNMILCDPDYDSRIAWQAQLKEWG